MTARKSWDEIKAARADSPDRRRGYENAGRAIRLAGEIRALRETRGLSQRELAEMVGTTRSAIARLEGGHVSPSLGSRRESRPIPASWIVTTTTWSTAVTLYSGDLRDRLLGGDCLRRPVGR